MVACEVQQVRISYRYWLGLSILRGILWLHSFENTKISLGIVLPAKGEKYEAKLSPLITTWLELALAVHPQPEAKSDSIFLLSPNAPIGDIGLQTTCVIDSRLHDMSYKLLRYSSLGLARSACSQGFSFLLQLAT